MQNKKNTWKCVIFHRNTIHPLQRLLLLLKKRHLYIHLIWVSALHPPTPNLPRERDRKKESSSLHIQPHSHAICPLFSPNKKTNLQPSPPLNCRCWGIFQRKFYSNFIENSQGRKKMSWQEEEEAEDPSIPDLISGGYSVNWFPARFWWNGRQLKLISHPCGQTSEPRQTDSGIPTTNQRRR